MKKIYKVLLVLLLVLSNLLAGNNRILAEDDYDESEETLELDVLPEETILQEEEPAADISLEIAEEEEEPKIPEQYSIPLPDTAVLFASSADDSDHEELLKAYINSLFYEEMLSIDGRVENLFDGYEIQVKKENGKKLEGFNLSLYNAIKEKITLTAAGELASTVYTLDAREDLHLVFTKEDLGVSEIFELKNGTYNLTDEAVAAVNAWLNYDTGLINIALLFDYPYELYWYDKTVGVSIAPESSSLSISTTDYNDLIITTPFNATFHVAQEYQDGADLVVDTGIGSTIQNALDNARNIVDSYASYSSDYEILKAYKDEICDLTEYNYDALDGVPYGNPWQLVYVFDNDSSTNVVCEGYSKAFQYLCDLTEFNDSSICAYTVTGMMDGGTGAGAHMWNIVTMDDGKNYLVDITNCDDGSAGYPDKLFLRGINESDTTSSVDGTYVFSIDGLQNIEYEYDGSVTRLIYSDAELTIARGDYEPQDTIPEGTSAYAILTGDGDLVFFRSETALSEGNQTVTVHDESYTGYVYTGIEEYTGFDPLWISNVSNIVHAYALDVIRPATMSKWFSSAVNLEGFSAANFDVSQAESMFFLFYNCNKLVSLDLSGWNPASVTRMNNMFGDCSSLEEIRFGPRFIGPSVTNVSDMFRMCSSLKKLDLSDFNTSSVTNMSTMFYGCSNLEELILDGFDTRSVTSMRAMFSDCSSLKELDLSSFVTTNVTDMNSLFYNCSSLERLDVSNFDLQSLSDSSINGMSAMFNGCNMLNSITLGSNWSKWMHNAKLPAGNWINDEIGTKTADELYDNYVDNRDTWAGEWYRTHKSYAVLDSDGNMVFTRSFNEYETGTGDLVDRKGNTYTGYIYAGVENIQSADRPWYNEREQIISISAADTIKPNRMYRWFANCTNLVSFDGTNFDTSQVTRMDGLFSGCEKLVTATMDDWNTENVTSMLEMFRSCKALISLDLSSFDTRKVTSMSQMFYICNSLESIDLSSFDTSNVTSMQCMFGFDYVLNSLDVSHFITSKVTSMQDMFLGCRKITSLDVSNFDTSKVTTMSGMFSGMYELESIDLSSFDTSLVTNMSWMFSNDTKLQSITFGEDFNTSNVTEMNSMFTNCAKLTELDLSNFDNSKVTDMTQIFAGCSALRLVRLGSGWTKWLNEEYLPTGSWINEAKGLIKTETELYDEYPSHASAWAGEWAKLNTYAVLNADNDLVFTRSTNVYANGSTGTLVDRFGNEIYGIIFADVEGIYNSGSNAKWHAYKAQIKNVYALDTIRPLTMDSWFMNCKALESFDGTNFDTSNVNLMDYLFYGCTNLTSVDVSGFDTSNVAYINYMFTDCKKLTELDLSNFDTSKVTHMYLMFSGCSELTTLDISSFSTEIVSNMSGMFQNCFKLSTIVLGKNWTTWTANCPLPNGLWTNEKLKLSLNESELLEQYPNNAAKWAGTWKRSMAYAVLLADGNLIFTRSAETFGNAVSGTLTDLKGNTYTGVIFANVENTPYSYTMPWSSYTSSIRYVSAVDTIRPKNMYNWFYGCSNLESFDSRNFDTSSTESMIQVFMDCVNLTYVDLSNFDTSKVDSFSGMFRSCEKIERLDLSSFDTSNTTSMEAMFYMCYKLKDLDISSFDTSKVTHMGVMFSRCRVLEELDLSHFDTSNVESMYDMFEDCYALKELDVSSFNTSEVYSMSYMFHDCRSLTSLDLSSFNTSGVENFSNMFFGCNSLETLDLSNFETPAATNMSNMFHGCSSLKHLDISSFDTSNLTSSNYFIYDVPELESLVLGEKTTLGQYSVLSTGAWTNGSVELTDAEFVSQQPDHMLEWAGYWYRKDSDAAALFGDITPDDRIEKGIITPADIPEGLWIAGVVNKEYTGNAITQEFRVYDGKVMLKPGVDYTVTYANNKNAADYDSVKAPTITVTGKGNYQGTLVKTFTIYPSAFSLMDITLNKDYFKYNGKVQKPTVTILGVDGKKLKEKTDYKLVFNKASEMNPDESINPKDDGDYLVLIIGQGNYEHSNVTIPFQITEKTPVNTLSITLSPGKLNYNGSSQMPSVLVKNGKVVLYNSADGSDTGDVSVYPLSDATSVGKQTIRIDGISSEYVGSVYKTYEITGTAISKAKIIDFSSSKPYNNGSEVEQTITLEYKGSPLTLGIDYSVTYENNIEIGTATMIITGRGGYTGTVKKTFKITGMAFNAKNIGVEDLNASYPYKGEAWIKEEGGLPVELVDNNTHTYISSSDYEISYKNNINAGTATITFTGKNGYTGSFSKTFKITKLKITDADVALSSSYTYAKGGVKPQPTIIVDGKKLVLNTDYTLSYMNNNKIGTATVTIKGKGNYEGTVNKAFTVKAYGTNGLIMTANDKLVSTKVAAMSTTVVITDRNGVKLAAGTDYDKNIIYTYVNETTVTDTSVKPNVPLTRVAGEIVVKTDLIPSGTRIKATVTMKGNYSGTMEKIFRIVDGDMAKATVTIPTQYFTGSPIYLDKDDIKVVINKVVLDSDDFEIVSYDKNDKVGTATVTIKAKDKDVSDSYYGGSKTVSFKIVKRSLGVVIRYHAKDATSGSMKDQLIYKTNVKLTKNGFKLTGKTLDYWYTKDGVTYYDQQVFPYDWFEPGTVIDLYAVWH